jgi:hypothetical protein
MAEEHLTPERGKLAHWKPTNVIGDMTIKDFLFSNDYRHIGLKGILHR